MQKILFNIFTLSIFTILTLASVSYVNLNVKKSVFNTPDEASNYITISNFSKTYSLFQDQEYTAIDSGNNLHPRGFINHLGKTVPFNFLGPTIFYSPLYLLIKDYTKYVNILFISLMIYSVKITLDLLIPNSQRLTTPSAFIGIISSPWILYYFNFSYYNIIGGTTFFAIALYFLLKFHFDNHISNLYFYVVFSSISTWFAYHFSIFYVALIISDFFANKEFYTINVKIIHLFKMLLIALVLFVCPLMIVNYYLYGNAFIYGYSLFTKFYFGATRSGSIVKNIITIIFPSQNLNFNIFWINLLTTTIYISPMLVLILIKTIGFTKKIVYYLPIIFWFLIYNGMGESFMSGSSDVTLVKSVIRYWLPIYYLLSISVAYYIIKYKKYISTSIIILILVANSMLILFSNLKNATAHLLLYENEVIKYTDIIHPSDYIVSSMSDKYLFNVGNTITWWPTWSGDDFYDSIQLQFLISYILLDEHRVFLYRSDRFDLDKISEIINDKFTSDKISDDLYQISLH